MINIFNAQCHGHKILQLGLVQFLKQEAWLGLRWWAKKLSSIQLGSEIKQGKKALALSADRGFKAEYKDSIKVKAKEAELSVRIRFGLFRNFRKFQISQKSFEILEVF